MPEAGTNANRITDVVVIGGGQAGLAMSRCLTDRSVDHVVLERAQVANSWTAERWDSLRLLTPNWMTRLPGYAYVGDDPDGYMTANEVAGFLDTYQRSFDAPMVTGVEVQNVSLHEERYRVATSEGEWRCRAVVIATGACSNPFVPAVAGALPPLIQQLSPIEYRNPDQLANGRVLIVGASASGLQIADELCRSGRDVTLAVSDHVRLPRRYRGMDTHWWLDAIGQLDERYDQVDDLTRARSVPSLQLIGSPERRDLDLNAVTEIGVDLVGRLVGFDGHRAQFSGGFANACTSADLKQNRFLDRCDEFAAERHLDAELGPAIRPTPTKISRPALELDLSGVDSVIWATGFRPEYPWLAPELQEQLLDPRGRLRHDGGVLPLAGLYALGMPFLRRRKSSFIDGVGTDAAELTAHLVDRLRPSGALSRREAARASR